MKPDVEYDRIRNRSEARAFYRRASAWTRNEVDARRAEGVSFHEACNAWMRELARRIEAQHARETAPKTKFENLVEGR